MRGGGDAPLATTPRLESNPWSSTSGGTPSTAAARVRTNDASTARPSCGAGSASGAASSRSSMSFVACSLSSAIFAGDGVNSGLDEDAMSPAVWCT